MTDDQRTIKLLESINTSLSDIKVQVAKSEGKMDALQTSIASLQAQYRDDNANSRLAVLEARSSRNDKLSAGVIVGVSVSVLTALGSMALTLVHKVSG